MTVLRISDARDFEAHWRRTWPQKSYSDLWEYRAAYRRPEIPLAGLYDDSRDAFLPLWIEPDDRATFFGGFYCEPNHLPHDTYACQRLLAACPVRTSLDYLAAPPLHVPPGWQTFPETRYESTASTFPQLLGRLSGERRRRIRRLSDLVAREVPFSETTLQRTVEWNCQNQRDRGRVSIYEDAGFRAAWGRAVRVLERLRRLHVVEFSLGDRPAGVHYLASDPDRLIILNGGHDPQLGLGNAVTRALLQWAVGRRAILDWMTDGSLTWKQTHWGFEPRPVICLDARDDACADDTAAKPEQTSYD